MVEVTVSDRCQRHSDWISVQLHANVWQMWDRRYSCTAATPVQSVSAKYLAAAQKIKHTAVIRCDGDDSRPSEDGDGQSRDADASDK